jgi:hypothetical protein
VIASSGAFCCFTCVAQTNATVARIKASILQTMLQSAGARAAES